MSDPAAWVKVGAACGVVRPKTLGPDAVAFTTVTKVGKTQFTVGTGERFMLSTCRRVGDNGPWVRDHVKAYPEGDSAISHALEAARRQKLDRAGKALALTGLVLADAQVLAAHGLTSNDERVRAAAAAFRKVVGDEVVP